MAVEFALHDLGWRAFQQLCHTITREVMGQTVERFLDANDGGRDGAFVGTWDPGDGPLSGQFVIQCKHTTDPRATLSLGDLRDEFAKAERLAAKDLCDVYVLMTNHRIVGRTAEDIVGELKSRGVDHTKLLGAGWINDTIVTNPRLRRLVPRLYGLGDLTEILDERARAQTAAVLNAMRSDLAKLVLTGVHSRAAEALESHSFVMLSGRAAAGKTTAAAQLALGAADDYGCDIVRLDRIGALVHRWNPDSAEPQLFWLDDVFGATHLDYAQTTDWTRALPYITGALEAGCRFVVTSRDYILAAAEPYLRPGSLPFLSHAEVVVDVHDLTAEERRHILYNHLRHGRQPDEFLRRAQLHLDRLADHPEFSPELARRLADPFFTRAVQPSWPDSLNKFFSRPRVLLNDVIRGLDADGRAALGLIYLADGWLESPVAPDPTATGLLERFGSGLAGVIASLQAMDGSIVLHQVRGSQTGWTFAHPTMAEAFADLLTTPELLPFYIAAAPQGSLLGTIRCGDRGPQTALTVPPALWDAVQDRLDEPPAPGREAWSDRNARNRFLATRCSRDFLAAWASRHMKAIDAMSTPGLMLNVHASNMLAQTLHADGLLPEHVRRSHVEALIEYAADGSDPRALWDEAFRQMFTDSELEKLNRRVRDGLLADPATTLWEQEMAGYDGTDPSQFFSHLEELVSKRDRIPTELWSLVPRLQSAIEDWIADHPDPDPEAAGHRSPRRGAESTMDTPTTDRSIFDDLVDGRGVGDGK